MLSQPPLARRLRERLSDTEDDPYFTEKMAFQLLIQFA